MATLLATIQEVCKRLAQPVPSTAFGSSDKAVVQMISILQEGLDVLASRGQWQELTTEYTWVTTAAEDQGSILTGLGSPVVAPNGFSYMLPQTLWDRTNKLPLVGPLDSMDWQAMKAWVINGPRYQFRLRRNKFLVNPVPTAGWTWAFEFISQNSISNTGGTSWYKRFAADSDIILLPDQIVQLDLRWRWKKEKGLPYAQDFEDCEVLLANSLSRNKQGKQLQMDLSPDEAGYGAPRPTIVVSPGSWNV